MTKAPFLLRLRFEDSPTQLRSIYQGTLASLRRSRAYDHASLGACGFAGAEAMVPVFPGDKYFLVVGSCGALESSYGRDSSGAERPEAASRCP